MDRYGSDKPDTRYGLELCDVSDAVQGCGFGAFAGAVEAGGSVRCINVKGGAEKFPRKKLDELTAFVKIYRAKGLAWMGLKPDGLQCSFAKFLTPEQIEAIQQKAGASPGICCCLWRTGITAWSTPPWAPCARRWPSG